MGRLTNTRRHVNENPEDGGDPGSLLRPFERGGTFLNKNMRRSPVAGEVEG